MFDILYQSDFSEVDTPEGEMVPVVDPTGVVTGIIPRQEAHSGSRLLHPVVHLHILDHFGKILLQKRSMNKHFLPGMWDSAVGGHVSFGESIEEALFRETREELGLTDYNPVFIDSYVYESSRERELVAVFATVGDFMFNPDRDEVEKVKWWSDNEIRASIGKGMITANFEQEYLKYSDKFAALL